MEYIESINSKLDLHFITPVWGRNHTNIFLNICLPSLLAPNNIPSLISKNCLYHIFTHENESIQINNSLIFKTIQRYLNTKISIIQENIENNHMLMSYCHRNGINYANSFHASSVFIPPDCIFSNNSIKNLQKIIQTKNITMVNISGIRVILEHMVPEIQNNYICKNNLSLDIEPRNLVKLAMQHLHPITNLHFFNERGNKLMPANLLWTVNENNILAHCFHLHPLYIAFDNNAPGFKSTIDDDLCLALNTGAASHYIVQDSDEILAFELSQLSHSVGANYNKKSIPDIAAWAEVGANQYHRKLVHFPIRIHSQEINHAIWETIEKEALYTIQQSLILTRKPTWYLILFWHTKNLLHRQYANQLNKYKLHLFDKIIIFLYKIIKHVNNKKFLKAS